MIEVKIPSAGGSQPVGFSMKDGCDLSKLKFDKETSCTWLTLSKGTSEISLTATKNERSDPRTCYITPSYDGVVCTKNVFAVTQDGSGEPPTPPTPTTCTCSITITGGTLPKAGYSEFTKIGTYTISSTCSGTWGTPTRIDGDESFVSEFDFSNNEIKVKVPENTRQLRRTKYKATIGVGDCSAEFTVEQEGTEPECNCNITVGSTSITLGSAGDSTADTTYSYDCENPPEIIQSEGSDSWLKVTPGTDKITFKTKIFATEERTASVDIKDSDGHTCETITVKQEGPTPRPTETHYIKLIIPEQYQGDVYIMKGVVEDLAQYQRRMKGSAQAVTDSPYGYTAGTKTVYTDNCEPCRECCNISAKAYTPNESENENWTAWDISTGDTATTYTAASVTDDEFIKINTFNIPENVCTGCTNTIIDLTN